MSVRSANPTNFSAGGLSHPGRAAGRSWPVIPGVGTTTASNAYAVDTLMMLPLIANNFVVPVRGLSVISFAGGSAGAQIKGGLWRVDPITLLPYGAAVASSPAVDITGTGEIIMAFGAPIILDDFDVLAAGVIVNTVTTQASLGASITTDNTFASFFGRLNTATSAPFSRLHAGGTVFASNLAADPIGAATFINAPGTPIIYAVT